MNTGRAIGYRRVSTQAQVDSGLGLEVQAAAITTAAARLRLELAAVFTDAGISGGRPLEQRPGLIAALDALGKGDVLIVARRDRLGRHVHSVATIDWFVERKHARIVSAAGEGTDRDDSMSRLFRHVTDAVAEQKRDETSERTKSALAVKKARGERVGGIDFGMRLGSNGRTLEPHPEEQRALAALHELRAAGFTHQAVADELNRRGFRSRTGGLWSKQSVHNICRRARLS